MDKHYLAVDLGAESGRVLLGTVGPEKLALEEVHRFPNRPVSVAGGLRWDLVHLYSEILRGLGLAARRGPIAGVSVDAWGVDYVLLRGGEPLGLPFHYRDARTDGMMEKVFARVPAEEIFAATGIQFMALNTLFQLCADRRSRPWVLETANAFLNIADFFNYLLSGVAKGERTLVSTTQLYDPRRGDWAWDLISRLELPRGIFPALVNPGTRLGPLLSGVGTETGLRDVQVVASCSHDTAAAVAAVPAQGQDWAFLSSGTWSLLGTELDVPRIDSETRSRNFTNEAAHGGKILFRKNIVGLWIVQECKRAWEEGGKELDYETLTAQAEAATPLRSLIRPDDARFAKPGDMPAKVAAYCRETGQPVPETPGAWVRCVLESLALLYTETLDHCSALTGRKFKVLHIVGGGSKNALLNRFTAGAANIRVLAGPAEATGLGNILVQAEALGHAPGDLRSHVRAAFPPAIFVPGEPAAWAPARRKFQSLRVEA